MQKVAIDSIVVDERLMIRELDQDIAVDYAAKMKEGAVFPPIVLFKIDDKIYLSSGRHRLEAHKLNAALEIDALIKDGSMDDAYLFALQDNAHHGHKLSQRNITEAVDYCINNHHTDFPVKGNEHCFWYVCTIKGRRLQVMVDTTNHTLVTAYWAE